MNVSERPPFIIFVNDVDVVIPSLERIGVDELEKESLTNFKSIVETLNKTSDVALVLLPNYSDHYRKQCISSHGFVKLHPDQIYISKLWECKKALIENWLKKRPSIKEYLIFDRELESSDLLNMNRFIQVKPKTLITRGIRHYVLVTLYGNLLSPETYRTIYQERVAKSNLVLSLPATKPSVKQFYPYMFKETRHIVHQEVAEAIANLWASYVSIFTSPEYGRAFRRSIELDINGYLEKVKNNTLDWMDEVIGCHILASVHFAHALNEVGMKEEDVNPLPNRIILRVDLDGVYVELGGQMEGVLKECVII